MTTFKVDIFTVDPCPQDKPWVGYARVSTQRQAEHGISVEDQEAEIIAYCQKNGIVLDKVFKEIASSKTISERPVIKELLLGVNCNRYAGIIAIDMTRITRSLIDQQIFIDPVGAMRRIKLTRSEYKNDNTDDFQSHTINTMISQAHRMRISAATAKCLQDRISNRMIAQSRFPVDYWLYDLEPVPKTKFKKMTPSIENKIAYLLCAYGYMLGLHVELVDCLLYVWRPDKLATFKSRRICGRLTKHLHQRYLFLPKEEEYYDTRLARYSLNDCILAYREIVDLIKKEGKLADLWKIPEPVATRQALELSKFQSKTNTKRVFMLMAWEKVVDSFPQALAEAIMPYYLICQIGVLSPKYCKASEAAVAKRPVHEALASGGKVFGREYDPVSGCLRARSDKEDH